MTSRSYDALTLLLTSPPKALPKTIDTSLADSVDHAREFLFRAGIGIKGAGPLKHGLLTFELLSKVVFRRLIQAAV